MKFSCKKCDAKYAVPDEKVIGKVIKLHCKRCHQLIVVRGGERPISTGSKTDGEKPKPVSEPVDVEFDKAFRTLYDSGLDDVQAETPNGSHPSTELEDQEWFFGLDGYDEGPFTFSELREKVRLGIVGDEHFVWREGLEDWLPVPEMPELAQLLSQSKRASVPPPVPKRSELGEAELHRKRMERERENAIVRRKRAEGKRRLLEEKPNGVIGSEEPELPTLIPQKEQKAGAIGILDESKSQKEEQKRQWEEAKRVWEEQKRLEDEQRRLEEEKQRELEKQKQWEQEKQQDPNQPLPAAVLTLTKKKEQDPTDPETARIAEHFFTTGERKIAEMAASLAGSADSSDLAVSIQPSKESLQEEYEDLQKDPIAVLTKRDEPGKSEISKVSRVIAANAGVRSRIKKLTMLLAGAFLVVGLFGVGVFLIIRGSKQADSEKNQWENQNRVGVQIANRDPKDFGDSKSEEIKKYHELLWKTDGQPDIGKRNNENGRKISDNELSEQEQKLKTFYQQQNEEKSELTPLGPDPRLLENLAKAVEMSTGVSPSTEIILPDKNEGVPLGPASQIDSGQLTEEQVHLVIAKYFKKVQSCYDRALKRDSGISGKLEVVARVNPFGRVEKVNIKTLKFRGTFVEECLISAIKQWRFPAFKGETHNVVFPLVLSRQETY